MRILRRLRGLVGLSIAWSLAWVPLSLCMYFVERSIRGGSIWWSELPEVAIRLGIVGALSGFAFGAVLALAERKRTFERLSLGRIASWGVLGGLAFPTLVIGTGARGMGALTAATVLGIYGVLGAVTSIGTLALARRAPALNPGDEGHHLAAPSQDRIP